jgi:hypothetical protein
LVASAQQLQQLLHDCPKLTTERLWQISQLQHNLEPKEYLALVQLLRQRADADPNQHVRLARRLAERSASLEARIREVEDKANRTNELRARCASVKTGQSSLDDVSAAEQGRALIG